MTVFPARERPHTPTSTGVLFYRFINRYDGSHDGRGKREIFEAEIHRFRYILEHQIGDWRGASLAPVALPIAAAGAGAHAISPNSEIACGADVAQTVADEH